MIHGSMVRKASLSIEAARAENRRHGGLDFRLPNAELADVEIDEQADAAGIAFSNLRGDHSGQRRRHLIGARGPILGRVVLDGKCAFCGPFPNPTIFVTAAAARGDRGRSALCFGN
jgi:hypothetical protein